MKIRHKFGLKTLLLSVTLGVFMVLIILFLLLPGVPPQADAIANFKEYGGFVSGSEYTVDTLWDRILPLYCRQFCTDNFLFNWIPLSESLIEVNILRLHNKHISLCDRKVLAQALYPLNCARICNFKNSNIDDAVLKYLYSFARLEVLVLADCPVSDEALADLALPRLQALDLSGTDVDGSFLESSQLRNLEYLSLANTKIGDNATKNMMPALRSLELDATLITDETIRNIGNLSNIHRLSLAGTKITDDALKSLAGMHKITALNLAGTAISDTGLQQLRGLDNLSYLVLRSTSVTDSALTILGELKNLRWLDVRSTRITGHSALEFRKTHPDICIFTD